MADADLDVIIRRLAKQQHKNLIGAVKARRDRYLALAAKAKDAAAKQRLRQMAKHAFEEGAAAARRMQMSADNAADSYARGMRRAADMLAAESAAAPKKTPARQQNETGKSLKR
ncbi:hypothetical protein NB311A_14385 [Nitrobacter sp. Nb-311A]|uniref:hypothetical protein n=1 Tax=Nitrobacter sp. Nb-311A TaxID=314253 RepID=UPI00006870ED|nr:hypothetical protein [Nitrobacter sp. Nb-311A]EAQ35091.1 hypothetical protein NB311A_14385 [Nitrobacter sp. Nb-311A]